MKNPYIVFGLDNTASFDEVSFKYEQLKAKYSEERFLPGEEGNAAAEKLFEVENAFKQIKEIHESRQAQADESDAFSQGYDYSRIDNLIKEGRYSEAQALLDSVTSRTGEWHYLQSIIFYKKEWLNDSRTQLQMAVNLEPNNEKYKMALSKLEMIIGNPKTDPRTIGMDPNAQTTHTNDTDAMCNGCSNCCMAYICTDCCCSLLGSGCCG